MFFLIIQRCYRILLPTIVYNNLPPILENTYIDFFADIKSGAKAAGKKTNAKNNPSCSVDGDRAVLEATINGDAKFYVCAQFGLPDETVTRPVSAETLKKEYALTTQYYEQLLGDCESATPSAVTDLGFKHSVLNHDYTHVGDGWLEGGHWWSSYLCNNYQISAATALRHFEDAKRALLFFANIPGGYGEVRASGQH